MERFRVLNQASGKKNPPMKLAEALSIRASLQRDMAWIKDQFTKISRVQEGAEPSENPAAMLERLDRDADEYRLFLAAINRANIGYRGEDGKTMTDLLATRDALRAKQSILNTAYEEATQRQERYSNHEIRWVPTMDVVNLRQRIESVNRELRNLNLKIQSLNWQIELADPMLYGTAD